MKKIAVIGLGNIATRHRFNLRQLFPKADIFVMSASGRWPTEVIPDSDHVVGDLDELISHQLDLVIIASPASFHAVHAIPLIKVGIPVLIEKPVTATTQDAQCLLQIVEQFKTPVAVGYCLRYLPSTLKIKELLDAGIVGELYNIFIQVGQYLPDWRPIIDYRNSVSARKDLGGGALLELSHELDYAQWLLGELKMEHAILRSSKELGLDVEDMVDIVLTTPTGAVCNIHLDFLQRSGQRTCSFVGSQGRLDWDLIKNNITFVDGQEVRGIYSEPEWDKNKMYLAMMQDFVRMVKGQPHYCISLEAATKTIQLIETVKAKANWSN